MNQYIYELIISPAVLSDYWHFINMILSKGAIEVKTETSLWSRTTVNYI